MRQVCLRSAGLMTPSAITAHHARRIVLQPVAITTPRLLTCKRQTTPIPGKRLNQKLNRETVAVRGLFGFGSTATTSGNFYDFEVKDIDGKNVNFSKYKGQVVLVVNLASQCGFTPQYAELQQIYEKYSKKGFTVLGFPCNQFGGQEPGSNPQIKKFAQSTYGAKFPLFAKVDVNGSNADPLFDWLKEQKGGLLSKDVMWNFSKFLVDKSGKVVGREVVKLLLSQGASVRALVRNKEQAQFDIGGLGSLEIVQGDVFQYATLPNAYGDSDLVVVCTGANDFRDPFGPFNVDFQGTLNLLAIAKRKGAKKFVLVSSIGADDVFNPLNLFWGVLFWKKRAEEEIQRSGLDYTIVRPGGLKKALKEGEIEGKIVMKGPNYYGVPPAKKSGSILRRQVAEVCVAALTEPAAKEKVVEVVAEVEAQPKTFAELFASVM